MKRSETKARLLQDREQLIRTLRDYDAGKLHHLAQRDREQFVDSVKKRIAELNDKIAGLERLT